MSLALTEHARPSAAPPMPFGVRSGVDPGVGGPSLPSFGPLTVRHDEARTYQQSHDRCHVWYAVDLSTSPQGDGSHPELYHKTLLFARAPCPALGETPRTGTGRWFTRLVNVFHLNHLLDGQLGQTFVNDRTAERMLEHFHLVGAQVLHLDAAHLLPRMTETALTVAAHYKARLFNIWLAQGRDMNVGDHLYLVLRKCRDRRNGAYVWRFLPWSTSQRRAPPRAEYTTLRADGTELAVGAALFVGRVSVFYGYQDPRKHQGTAIEALRSDRMGAYKDYLVQLPEVEVFLNVH